MTYQRVKHGPRLLTQDEFNALDVGTRVVITWSGGNGPHLYQVLAGTEGGRSVEPSVYDYKARVDCIGPGRTQASLYTPEDCDDD